MFHWCRGTTNVSEKIVIGEFANFRKRIPGILKALAVGIPAGYILDLLNTPIPWMIGPMITVATLSLTGVRMHSPPYARHLGQVILGSAVSLYFTPTVIAALAGNFSAIVAATIVVFLIGALGALMLSRTWERNISLMHRMDVRSPSSENTEIIPKGARLR
jgi:uncharacterized membrane protein AbrB (regulator of aidB expression)